MAKQKPTMTPRQQIEAARLKEEGSSNMGSSASMWLGRAKLGPMKLPPPEENDRSLDNGARQKLPMRYE